MQSMTGYGRGESIASGMRCVVECASVNRKGLEVACQLPREFAAREAEVREAVSSRIARGRVNISVTINGTNSASTIAIDRHLIRALVGEVQDLQKEFHLEGRLDINTLLTIPGVIHAPETAVAEMWPIAATALDEALTALAKMRHKEGRHLERDLRTRLAALRKFHVQMRRRAKGVSTRYRDQLLARLESSGLPLSIDDPRLVTEIALFAERCDVSEELTRLESHFDQFAAKLEAKEPIGRALEFLTQEIYRELNTLGSKAADSALNQLVVDAKVELDRIREQVLNVE